MTFLTYWHGRRFSPGKQGEKQSVNEWLWWKRPRQKGHRKKKLSFQSKLSRPKKHILVEMGSFEIVLINEKGQVIGNERNEIIFPRTKQNERINEWTKQRFCLLLKVACATKNKHKESLQTFLNGNILKLHFYYMYSLMRACLKWRKYRHKHRARKTISHERLTIVSLNCVAWKSHMYEFEKTHVWHFFPQTVSST